jgi:predicted anti-sigma-YlaC factor YlaD
MNKKLKNRLMAYMAGNLSCREVADLITEYLDGSLSLGQRVRVQIHLGMCFACRNFLKQMQYTLLTLQRLPPEPIPPHIKEELLRRFRHWRSVQSSPDGSSTEKTSQ